MPLNQLFTSLTQSNAVLWLLFIWLWLLLLIMIESEWLARSLHRESKGDRYSAGQIYLQFLHRYHCCSMVIRTAPLLGLLGTVIGMLELFELQAQQEEVGKLGGAIADALIPTLFGISIALLALLWRSRIHQMKEQWWQLSGLSH